MTSHEHDLLSALNRNMHFQTVLHTLTSDTLTASGIHTASLALGALSLHKMFTSVGNPYSSPRGAFTSDPSHCKYFRKTADWEKWITPNNQLGHNLPPLNFPPLFLPLQFLFSLAFAFCFGRHGRQSEILNQFNLWTYKLLPGTKLPGTNMLLNYSHFNV